MPNRLKISDVPRVATLLKKLVEKSDVNQDGAVRSREARMGITSKKKPNDPHPPSEAIYYAMLFSQHRGSTEIKDIKKSIDEIAKRVKASDRDGDGFVAEGEQGSAATGVETSFVTFGARFGGHNLSDFNLPTQHQGQLPRFSWKGTSAEVCSSLLLAFSDRKNDNFLGNEGPSRFVLTQGEAQKMVAALKPLSAPRQKAVLTELASRTLVSKEGCVSVNAGARAVFEQFASDLGVHGLKFKSPAAPRAPR